MPELTISSSQGLWIWPLKETPRRRTVVTSSLNDVFTDQLEREWGVRGEALLRQHNPFLIYSRLLDRYLKTTWTFFLLFGYLLSHLPENILLALATGSSLLMLMCVFTRFPIFRVSLQSIEAKILDVWASQGIFYPRVWSIWPKGGGFRSFLDIFRQDDEFQGCVDCDVHCTQNTLKEIF